MITAVLGCLSSSVLFVGLLYIWPGSHTRRRDDPITIFQRSTSVVIACGLSWLPLYWQIKHDQPTQGTPSLLALLGIRRNGLLSALTIPSALTALFFLGPLAHRIQLWLHQPHHHGASDGSTEKEEQGHLVQNLLAWRNLVLAPLAEEWVFRACMAPLLHLQGASTACVVLATPLFFGAAHLHHLWDLIAHQRRCLADAINMVGFQFTYTTVFGWYATLLFLRTGHLASAVVAHAMANWMGVPPFDDMFAGPLGRRHKGLTVAGVVAFLLLLEPLTRQTLYI